MPSVSLIQVFFKKKIANSVSAAMYMWVGLSLILIVLTPFMALRFSDVVSALVSFPVIVLGAALSNIIATQLNLEALKREDLSYTAPLNAFVPVFTLLLAALFLGESPPKFGILGIVIVVIGAYIVSIKPERIHWYDPLKRLATSVRRLDAIFSVLLGWRYLKEKDIRLKLTGSIVMTVGAVATVLS